MYLKLIYQTYYQKVMYVKKQRNFQKYLNLILCVIIQLFLTVTMG